jgi:hypothetical protein
MQKKKALSKADKKKEYLDENVKPNTITAKFFLQQLLMKDVQWKMKIKVEDILPRTYYKYTMTMVFDPSPYERKIKALEDQIADIRDSKQKPLFDADQKEQVGDIEEEIESEKESMEDRRKECPSILMPARVEELKYSGNDTLLTFQIPDTVINELNENKLKFGSYCVELTPEM